MNNGESKLEKIVNKMVEEGQIIEEKEVISCPVCNKRLRYKNMLY